MRIKDLMSRNFTVLDQSLSTSEAHARLSGGRLGVVVDAQGTPCSLVTAEDISVAARLGAGALCGPEATLPRTMVVELERGVPELSEEQLRYLIESGSHGIVAVDDRKMVAGVIPVCSMFVSTLAAGAGGLMMLEVAGSLAGVPNTEPLARTCLTCRYLNHIHYLDDDVPPRCKNPETTSHELIFRA